MIYTYSPPLGVVWGLNRTFKWYRSKIHSVWINLQSLIIDPSCHGTISVIWVVVDKAWNRPTTNIDTWSKDELNACNWNNKGLNTIFMVVSPDEFKRISMCKIAKNACYA